MPEAQSNDVADSDAERAQELFQSSQTFLMRMPDIRVMRMRMAAGAIVLLLFYGLVPLLNIAGKVPDYKVNILGQYLCYAIVALGVDLIWGYTGLLSLCQALFFALGAYAMAMHLSLPEGGGQYKIPQFMEFAYYGHGGELPAFWRPFRHFTFALFAGIAIPGIFATLFGFLILRSRVRGVYFSIITQALAAATWLLMCRNEMLVGGTNGLTNFYRPMTADRRWIISLYLLTLTVLVLAYLFCRSIVKSRLGRVLVAIRDKETRLYFAGYKPYAFKVFALAVGGMLAGIGGMLYSPQTGIITPQQMNVEESILMVVMVALGGRGRLWGAVCGAILFRAARSSLTSDFSGAWLLVEGLIAVVVVLFFSDGFSGLWLSMERQITAGQTVLRASITIIPLVAVCLFLAIEALGLTPRFLQSDPSRPQGIAPKYYVLIAVLVAVGIFHRVNSKITKQHALSRSRTSGSAMPQSALEAAGVKGGA